MLFAQGIRGPVKADPPENIAKADIVHAAWPGGMGPAKVRAGYGI